MSGPPPCTTIGFSPTYFRSTTSRAKSSRSAGSLIAAPPYLITTVLPWNSRMYGSASRGCLRLSRRVVRVDGHVLVREVREEDLRLGLAAQRDRVLDLVAERQPVERHADAARAHLDVLDPDVGRHRVIPHGAADRLGDPAPVR